MRSYKLVLFIGAVWASQASAEPSPGADAAWGADDLRRVMIDWMSSNGRAAPDPKSIGPLDPRLSVAACDKVEISPRGSSSTTFTVRCKGPSDWTHVLRIDQPSQPPAPKAAAEPSANAPSWVVVVPKVELPTGTILTAEVLEERKISSPPVGQVFKTVKEAVGLRVSYPIGPGAPLTARNVARAPLVAKGENVTLVANGSGFEISVPGRAEQDGYEGDLISVKNIKTGAILKGRLERGKLVSVMQL